MPSIIIRNFNQSGNMATFNTKKQLGGDATLIPEIATKLESYFGSEGYSVDVQNLYNGGSDISVSKGGMFKAVLGMKTALKISLTPNSDGIWFEAGIGIFGQQIIPTLITWYIAWPVLITQIWGMVKQAKLDDKALEIAEQVIRENSGKKPSNKLIQAEGSFCSYCGKRIPLDAVFCPSCGKKKE